MVRAVLAFFEHAPAPTTIAATRIFPSELREGKNKSILTFI
jgi:hypothetical protein